MEVIHNTFINQSKLRPITLLLQDGREIIVEIIPDACDASTIMVRYRGGETSRMPRGDVKACSVVVGWGENHHTEGRSAA